MRAAIGLACVLVGSAGIVLVVFGLWSANAILYWPIGRLDAVYAWRSIEVLSWLGLFGFVIGAGLFVWRGAPSWGGSTPATVMAVAVALHMGLLSYIYQNPYAVPIVGRADSLVIAVVVILLLGASMAVKPKQIPKLLRPGVNSGAAGILMVGIGIVQFLAPAVGGGFEQTLAWDVVYTFYFVGDLLGGNHFLFVLDVLAVALAALAELGIGVMLVAGSTRAWRWGVAVSMLLCWMNLRVVGTMADDGLLAASFIFAQIGVLFLLGLGRPTARRELVAEYDPMSRPFDRVAPSIDSGEGWRNALVQSLSETGVSRRRHSVWLRVGLYAALLLLTGGVAIFRIYGLPQLLVGLHWTRQWTILTIWTVVSIFFIFSLIAIVSRMLAAMRAHGAAAELMRPDARRPVLFLRSFEIDEATARPPLAELLGLTTIMATPEQRLVKTLARSGPVLAIGRPGEKLPPLGAARFYVSDALWRQKIADIASVAQLVVVTSGVTAGLAWEIRHLMASVAPERLALWAHPHLTRWRRTAREVEWTLFTMTLGRLFQHPFPTPLGRTELFTFDKAGAPQRVEPNLSVVRRLIAPFFGILVPSAKAVVARAQRFQSLDRSAELA